jgi:16S rRNA (uracil1498-N3)-methyltransferase
MSVTRLALPGQAIVPGELVVPATVARHARVARVVAGDSIELLDLAGTVGIGHIVSWRAGSCTVVVERVERERGEPCVPLVLGLGVLHTTAFDWAVEKATELGVSEIVPVVSERSQRGRHEARLDRWERVATAAVSQCARTRVPALRAPVALAVFLASAVGLRWIADAEAVDAGEPPALGPEGVAVLVGPEGGFTTAESRAALSAGFRPLALGPRTLRAETAAVAALAVVQQRSGWLLRSSQQG